MRNLAVLQTDLCFYLIIGCCFCVFLFMIAVSLIYQGFVVALMLSWNMLWTQRPLTVRYFARVVVFYIMDYMLCTILHMLMYIDVYAGFFCTCRIDSVYCAHVHNISAQNVFEFVLISQNFTAINLASGFKDMFYKRYVFFQATLNY